jgi:hypothetical protein
LEVLSNPLQVALRAWFRIARYPGDGVITSRLNVLIPFFNPIQAWQANLAGINDCFTEKKLMDFPVSPTVVEVRFVEGEHPQTLRPLLPML